MLEVSTNSLVEESHTWKGIKVNADKRKWIKK